MAISQQFKKTIRFIKKAILFSFTVSVLIVFSPQKLIAKAPSAKPDMTLNQAVSILNPKDWGFQENQGQLADENGNVSHNVIYYGKQGGVGVYCQVGKISFVFTK